MTPDLYVVGVGEDGPATLGDEARSIVAAADLLCGGERILRRFSEHPAPKVTINADLERLYRRIEREPADRRVVVLASGDPCFHGIGPLLAERFGMNRTRIIPSPSSIALAFARLGTSWHDATVVSAHGRPLEQAVRAAVIARKIAFFTDATNTPATVAGALLDAGVEDAAAWVFERLGGIDERMIQGPLSALIGQEFDPLNVLLVIRDSAPTIDRVFGRAECEFDHSAGLITHAEVRAVVLAKLQLRPNDVMWDVGSGSGSVAVEAAGLLDGGRVWAVEQDPRQIELIETNIRRLGRASRVCAIHGEAPEALYGLADPDAVFVGGGGKKLEPILDHAFDRLPPGRRIVATFATLDGVQTASRWAALRGIAPDICQISVARGAPIGDRTRLAALNPVFVAAMAKPDPTVAGV